MGLAPEEMLQLVYPPEPGPKSPAAERLKAYLDAQRAPGPRTASEPTLQEIEMGEAIERVLSGIVEKLGPVPLFGGLSERLTAPAAPATPAGSPEPPAEPPPAPRRKRQGRKTGT